MNEQIEVYFEQLGDKCICGKVISMPQHIRGKGLLIKDNNGYELWSQIHPRLSYHTLFLWGIDIFKSDSWFKYEYDTPQEAEAALKAFKELINMYNTRKKEILTPEEKEYLSSVIKPFKDRVLYICKGSKRDVQIADIWIAVNSISSLSQKYANKIEYITFPIFDIGTMYNGLVTDQEYSLRDLNLD